MEGFECPQGRYPAAEEEAEAEPVRSQAAEAGQGHWAEDNVGRDVTMHFLRVQIREAEEVLDEQVCDEEDGKCCADRGCVA